MTFCRKIRLRDLLADTALATSACVLRFNFLSLVLNFLCFLRLFAAIPLSPSFLCAFASSADVAKGRDGAKSALREIFSSLSARNRQLAVCHLSFAICYLASAFAPLFVP
jgi:hypothetical protein